MGVDGVKKENVIYQIRMKGKSVQIADVISYPASGLGKDTRYWVTVSRLPKVNKTVFNPSKRQKVVK